MTARKNRGTVTIRDMTHTDFSMEQLSKHVSAETNTRNNRGAVFSVQRSVSRGYEKDKEDRLRQLSSERAACQDMSLGTEELRHQNYCVQLRLERQPVKKIVSV
jgi:hypothetical protein